MIEPHSSFVEIEHIRLHYLEWDALPVSGEHLLSTPLDAQQITIASNSSLADVSQDTQDSTHDTYRPSAESDEIPLVLLHGLGATAETWSMVARDLYQRHRVVAFDLRGHGESDKPETGYDLLTVSEDIVAAMAALGMGQVALVAHGWGARVALVLAARHPALVSHLVLVDCPHVEPRHWPGMTRQRFIREQEPTEAYSSCADFLAARQQEMAAFWSNEVEQIVLHTVQTLPDGRVIERLGAEQQRLIRAALWEDRALSYYSKLACPVLLVPAAPEPGHELPEQLLHTDEFALAKGHMAQQVSTIIPHCSLLWMPDTTHDIQLQRPSLLAQAIAQFITGSY